MFGLHQDIQSPAFDEWKVIQLAIAKIIQLLWALFFVLTFGLWAFAIGGTVGISLVVISILYLTAAIACLTNSRIGWMIAIVIPVLPLVRWTPMVFVNFWMFFNGHELYQDSPATIVIVAINGFMFVLPGVLIYLCLALDNKRLLTVLRPTAAKERNVHSLNLAPPARDFSIRTLHRVPSGGQRTAQCPAPQDDLRDLANGSSLAPPP